MLRIEMSRHCFWDAHVSLYVCLCVCRTKKLRWRKKMDLSIEKKLMIRN